MGDELELAWCEIELLREQAAERDAETASLRRQLDEARQRIERAANARTREIEKELGDTSLPSLLAVAKWLRGRYPEAFREVKP